MRRCFLFPLALSLLAPIPARAAPALPPAEQKVIAGIDAGAAAEVAFLQALVEQNSGTFHLAGVRAVADLVRPRLEAMGFAVEWKPMDAVQRAGHLIATHRGDGTGKRILLIGHLDTVFEPDNPFAGFRREGNRAYGPGVGDDKGGVVVMLSALQGLHDAGLLRDADVRVVLTGDEEEVGVPVDVARADLVAAGKWADVALDFENLSHEDGREMGAVARRSSNVWTLTVRGESGHSSGIFSERMGDGAAFELARILTTFRSELPEPNLTFNIGILGGGEQAQLDGTRSRINVSGKDNIVPGIAIARGDFRTLSREQTARVRERMQAIVSRHLPRTSATLDIEEHYPPMAPTPGNRALLARLNAVNADLGFAPMGEIDPLRRGAGDIAFVAADVDGLVGLGASGGNSHEPGEFIEIDALPRQAKRAALLIHRLARERR